MSSDQSCRLEYGDDTIRDAELRSHFRLQLAGQNMELFHHHWLGPELRSIFYALLLHISGECRDLVGEV